ncbi:MAG TPA: S1C family serine protease [Candidatus Acidoferrum sp.]|nr:S1C family serine protease [Candidatus Acidoferrum sp.]
MNRRLLATLILTIALPGFTFAVVRPREPRLDPRSVAEMPSYVRRIEPVLVGLRVSARKDAASSARLGTQRFATGVIVDTRGYAVTVSYAVMDAVRIEARTRDGRATSARLTAIDFETGLGVVKLEGDGPWPAATLGSSSDVRVGSLGGTVGVDEDNDLAWVTNHVQAVRRFSGYWEYMLDRALIVGPSTDSWGGSAVVDARGAVLGIASLRLGEPPHVNVAIPIDKFIAVKDELIAAGRVVSRPARPWLGLYTVPREDGVVIDGFASSGPARESGLRRGDRILSVNGVTIASQEEFYEQLWRGRAGDVIRLAVQREAAVHVIPVPSVDRYRLLGK